MEQNTIDIDELERLAKAATPGPWSQAGCRVTAKELGYDRVADTEFDNESMAENAAFIAAANPATITALIDSLHKANGRLHEAATHCANVEAERDEAKMRVQILERNLHDAEEAGRRLAKQAHQAEQERDALAARLEVIPGGGPDGIECRDSTIKLQDARIAELEAQLKELEGQEPVAWVGHGPRDGRVEFSISKPVPSVFRDFGFKPLFARPVPAEPVNARLVEALKELLTDVVIAQGNMRDAAKRDQRWEGCADAIQPRVDAARSALAAAEVQQAEPNLDGSVDRAWARFCGAFGDGPDAPYPGMIAAFETHYGQSFRDKAWRTEAACWAAAWHKATEQADKQAEPVRLTDGSQRLDWIEQKARESRTGVSFDFFRHSEEGRVIESGYRVMWRNHLGQRFRTLLEAIDDAMSNHSNGYKAED